MSLFIPCVMCAWRYFKQQVSFFPTISFPKTGQERPGAAAEYLPEHLPQESASAASRRKASQR